MKGKCALLLTATGDQHTLNCKNGISTAVDEHFSIFIFDPSPFYETFIGENTPFSTYSNSKYRKTRHVLAQMKRGGLKCRGGIEEITLSSSVLNKKQTLSTKVINVCAVERIYLY